MKKKTLSLFLILVLSLGVLAGCGSKEESEKVEKEETPVAEADFPTKKINLIVPWSAGGITDRVARVFAPLFEKHLGQPVTVIMVLLTKRTAQ